MLVNCVAYHRGQKLADIPLTEVRAHLERRDCFVWVALKDPEPAELEALQQEFNLHELAIEDAQKGHQRPKIDEYGSSLFVVMHLIEPVGADLQTGEVAIFVGPQYIVSVRRDAQLGFTEVRRRCELEPELLQHGPAYVLYALMDNIVDRYFPVLEQLTAEIEEVEERIFAGQTTRAQIEAHVLAQAEADDARPRDAAVAGSAPASCTAAACRRSAPACTIIFAMSTTTCCG